MLRILPLESKQEQQRICGLCGIPYDAESLAYGAWEGELLVGGAQFRLAAGGVCELRDLSCARGVEDDEALFIMGRGLLNFVDRVGYHDAVAVFPQRISTAVLHRIGFFADESGKFVMNLRGRFDGSHHAST